MKYISFSLSNKLINKCQATLQFIDGFRFLSASLENLLAYLRLEDYKIFKYNMYNIELLLQKDPCQYFLLWISLMKPHCPMWSFFSDLTQQHISGEDYANAHSGTCSIFKHRGTVTIYARSVRSFPIIGHVPEFLEAVYTVLWIRLCTLCYCTQSSLASFSLNGPAIPRIVRICWYASYGSTYHSRST